MAHSYLGFTDRPAFSNAREISHDLIQGYVAGELDAGHYVNFVFHADSQLVSKLRAKFKLDPEVYRQHYQKLRPKKEKKERSSKKLAEAK